MEAIHPDLYHSTSKSELEREVKALEAAVATSNDDQVMVGLLRIVAMVSAKGRDGHTGAFIWGKGSYPVHSLPLRFWLFSDGLFVVAALPPYRRLVGSRIVAVAGRPTGEVLAALDPLIPRDNPSTVTLLTPRFLLIPEVLHGLGLIETGPIELRVVAPDGSRETAAVDPISMTAYNDWAGEYGLHLPPKRKVLYLERSEEPLWFRFLAGSGTLYIQYSRVEFLSSELLDSLQKEVGRPRVKRIVVDIRHNYGGETHAYPDALDVLASASATRSGHLFVITGRNTFSAAALFAAEVERETRAVFVGEPMGGSPNLYGNTRDVSLAYSGILVTVAEEYFVRSSPDDPRLTIVPQIEVRLTSRDYFAGRDPALEAILKADG
jgi:Peptidase family S41